MSAEDALHLLGLDPPSCWRWSSPSIGIRSEKFPPSRGVLLAGVGASSCSSALTAVFAWQRGEDEQEHRDELRASGEEPRRPR